MAPHDKRLFCVVTPVLRFIAVLNEFPLHPKYKAVEMNNLEGRVEAQSDGNFGNKEAKAESERFGTLADQRDMYRMGKTPRLRVGRKPGFIFVS